MKEREYRFGNTKIESYDDAIRGEEEVRKIVERVGKISDRIPLKAKKASA